MVFVEKKKYIEIRIIPLLSFLETHLTPWTSIHVEKNNNTESMNHVLKQATQWRLHEIPQLIETVSSVATFQLKEIERALLFTGEYILSEPYRKYQGHPLKWVEKSAQERRSILDKFISMRRPSMKSMVSSTDGNLVIPITPSAGKKPHKHREEGQPGPDLRK